MLLVILHGDLSMPRLCDDNVVDGRTDLLMIVDLCTNIYLRASLPPPPPPPGGRLEQHMTETGTIASSKNSMTRLHL